MVTTSKSMHREVQIKLHIDGLDTKRVVCVRKQTVFMSFLPIVFLFW